MPAESGLSPRAGALARSRRNNQLTPKYLDAILGSPESDAASKDIDIRTMAVRKKRFDRASFHAKVGELDADALRKILWNLYWRGSAALRERIEDALDPVQAAHKRQAESEIDGEELHEDVLRFVELARSGAYVGGTREVSRQERTKWRVIFKRFVNDATALLQRGDLENGAPAIEALIDLLCDTRDYVYFRSEDPVAAVRIVVSETVKILWLARLQGQGFAAFARSSAEQLIRWESAYGWTRHGGGPVAERETSLARVLADLLRGQDAWEMFCDAYLASLDGFAPRARSDGRRRGGRRSEAGSHDEWRRSYARERRAENLAEWHGLLLHRLDLHDSERRLDRIASHPALVGPAAEFMKARIRHLRGDEKEAHTLIEGCLRQQPGHREFIAFAQKIDATLPPRSAEILRERGA